MISCTKFDEFAEFGRIRQIAKDVDPYALVFRDDLGRMFVALSSGQRIRADKFKSMKDSMVFYWLHIVFTIKMGRVVT